MFRIFLLGVAGLAVAAMPVADVRADSTDTDAPVVQNPAKGADPDQILELEPWWVVDTDAEDVLIGRISDVEVDEDGNFYLLDNQLSEIFVYSPQGEYLRTIGQEGEGPGEFRNPMEMFLLNDGSIGVVQLMPGKVAVIDKEGTPLGDLSVPRSADDTPQMLMGGQSAGDHVVMQLNNHAVLGTSIRTQSSLVGVARDGSERATYYDHVDEQQLHMEGGGIAISIDSEAIGTWAAGGDGTFYHALGRNDYSIKVIDADGKLQRVIEREYESRVRPSEEIEAMREGMSQFGGPAPEVAETDPDIEELLPRPDGTLWVLTSRGRQDRPDGSVGVFDVFDADGRFRRQLDIRADFDPEDDTYYIRGDYLVVVENGAGSFTSGGGGMQIVVNRGGRAPGEDDEEPEAMKIRCYRLGV